MRTFLSLLFGIGLFFHSLILNAQPLISAQNGGITLTTNVTTLPAVLNCDKYSFIAQLDRTTGLPYFDFATLFNTVAPQQQPTIPISLHNCVLQDSNITPVTYATIQSISNLAIHNAQDGSGTIWAANLINFSMGFDNFLVKKTTDVPTQDDANAFNQYNITILPITSGNIILAGAITNFFNDIYLACNSNPAIKLSQFNVPLQALHGKNPVDITVNYDRCILESDPTQPHPIIFALFSINGLNGTYSINPLFTTNSMPMWATSLTNIAAGNSAYTVDTTPITTNCDYQNPTRCNQIQLNFHGPIAGKIDILNVSNAASLSCNGGKNFTGTPIPNGLSFDLATLHGTDQDASINLNLTHCVLFQGITAYGIVDLDELSGIYNSVAAPPATMWATAVTNLGGGLVFTSSDTCDKTNTHCNHWVLTTSAK